MNSKTQIQDKAKLSYSQDVKGIKLINPNAAGIDIGADSHWVSVPPE
jgi:hypothetical protein